MNRWRRLTVARRAAGAVARRAAGWCGAGLLLVASLLPAPAVRAAGDPAPAAAPAAVAAGSQGAEAPAAARAMLAEINGARRSLGLAALTLSETLSAAAAAHLRYLEAAGMATGTDIHAQDPERPYFTGATALDRARAAGWRGAGVAEVIAREPSVFAAVEGWLATPYHRGPLLDPRARAAGVAAAEQGAGSYQVVLVELGREGAGSEPLPYPAPGQTGVPTGWHGLETPDPLRFFPGARGPLGYTVSLSFPGPVRRLNLETARITGPGGEVAAYLLRPETDEHLRDMVALLPREPLAPLTTYTVEFAGEGEWDGGGRRFRQRWQFTTAGRAPDFTRTFWWDGRDGTERFEVLGSGLGAGTRLFLDGLPVQALDLQGDRAGFQPPAGLPRRAADLLAVGRDGEVRWPEFIEAGRAVVAAGEPPTLLPLQLGGRPLAAALSLRPAPGDWLAPAAVLAPLGGTAQPGSGHGLWLLRFRQRWLVAGPTTAWAWAGDAAAPHLGQRVQLARPPVLRGGALYLPPAALAALGLRAVAVEPAGPLVVTTSSLPDMTGHWAMDPVLTLFERDLISGYPDGRFHPDRRTTRAELIRLLAPVAGLEPVPVAAAPPLSVPDGHWLTDQGWLQAAVGAGLLLPADYPEGLNPDGEATRLEAVVMAVRALGPEAAARARTLQSVPAGYRDADAVPAAWRGHVAVAIERGLLLGYPTPEGDRVLRLHETLRRAEAAVLAVRALRERETVTAARPGAAVTAARPGAAVTAARPAG